MKNFTMRDEEFTCENCGQLVHQLKYTARDHCPHCLYSKHVDIMPGDRQNPCKGLLKPIGIEKFKDAYKIIYKECQFTLYHFKDSISLNAKVCAEGVISINITDKVCLTLSWFRHNSISSYVLRGNILSDCIHNICINIYSSCYTIYHRNSRPFF